MYMWMFGRSSCLLTVSHNNTCVRDSRIQSPCHLLHALLPCFAVDPMYQYSLAYFARLFNSCIEQSEKRDDLQERLTLLMDNITFEIFANICRGLFESHKLMFSFLIATQIMINAGDISQVWLRGRCLVLFSIYNVTVAVI